MSSAFRAGEDFYFANGTHDPYASPAIGDWRIKISGTDLLIQRCTSLTPVTWTTKQTIAG